MRRGARFEETPERRQTRERVFSEAYSKAEGGGAAVAMAFLAISVLVFIAAYSLYQITQPSRATTLLEAGIVATTDLDPLLAEALPNLRQVAAETDEPLMEIPGYPLDVGLTPDEVLELDDEEIRALVLERSAAIVYHEGLSAFDRTGEQSIDFLSVSGLIDQIVGVLTDETHDRAGLVAVIALALATITGAATLAFTPGFARFRAFGVAILLAAVPGFLLAWGASFVLDRVGGEDVYIEDLRTLAGAILDVPQRNFLIAGALGLAVAVAGPVLGFASRRFERAAMRSAAALDLEPVPESASAEAAGESEDDPAEERAAETPAPALGASVTPADEESPSKA